MKVKVQELTGTAYFDNEAGRLVEMKQVLRLEIEGRVAGRDVREETRGTMALTLRP